MVWWWICNDVEDIYIRTDWSPGPGGGGGGGGGVGAETGCQSSCQGPPPPLDIAGILRFVVACFNVMFNVIISLCITSPSLPMYHQSK